MNNTDMTIYEKPSLVEADSYCNVFQGVDSGCQDGITEEMGDNCPAGADD